MIRTDNLSKTEREPTTRGPKETSRQLGRLAGLWLFRLLMIVPVVVGLFVVIRFFEFRHLVAETDKLIEPTLPVVHAQAGPSQVDITLPGNLAAFSEAALYARTSGYIKTWSTDLGAKVAAGQVMAEITAPDVDAQLNQAKGSLAQAQANVGIAQLNYQRQQDLLSKRVSSQQEFDQSRANFEAAAAAVKASQANADNLAVQQGFQKIIAPFPGIVTERSADVGALISATTDSSAGKPLFRLARTDILRVFIDVPQTYSPSIHVGTRAYLTLSEFPGEKFEGQITNISGAIDPMTRTLRTEVQVPNTNGRLFPGAYAQVHLILPLKPAVVVPSNTLIFRSEGLQVGTVDAQGTVHLKKVTIGRDFGSTVEIASGLDPADQIIVNPSDSLTDGSKVLVKELPKPKEPVKP